jgi:uncharacterized protein with HEPN domain
MPEERDAAYVWDIVEAARRARAFVAGMSQTDFERDPKTYFAVIAQFQIIGEAAKRASEPFQQEHPEVPWSDMARMRDWLIHHYDQVKLDVVWDTLARDVPILLTALEPLLPSE